MSLSSAALLTVGLGTSLVVASRGLDLSSGADGKRIEAARVAREVARDLQQATRFTEQSATATTMLVPDRDADGKPESIRYAWSGSAGAPLTYSLNGGSPVNVASSVHSLNLSFTVQPMTATAAPTESANSATKLLYITAGTQVQASGGGASQRMANPVILLTNPSALDRLKIELFESWGYDVTYVLPNEPWSNLTSLVDQAQLTFVSAEADTTQLNSSIYDSTKGIVIERAVQYDDAHFANNANVVAGTSLRVRKHNHYIMSGYSNNQSIPVLSTSSALYNFSSLGNDVTNLMGTTTSETSMMALSPGDRMANGSDANGRRVLLPWGVAGLSFNSLTTEGKAITRRALEWAAGAGSDPNNPFQTFGNTSVYANLLTPGAGKMVATKVNLPQRGEVKSISAFVGGPIGTIRYAIYSHHASNRPNGLIAQSSPSLTGSSGTRWVTLNIPDTDLPAGDYWLAVCFGLNSQTLNMTPGGDYTTLNYDATLAGFRSTWGTPESQEAMSFSIYATYEVE